jgi:DNA adenine methylase
MTSYQGGKKRIGKRIYTVITELEQILTGENKLPYFEPFVGMAGVLRHFAQEPHRRVTACDSNIDLILMWQALQKGWNPPRKCSRAKYEELKRSTVHSAERAFIGCAASFGANFFGNYRLHYDDQRDLLNEGRQALLDVRPKIERVRFLKARSYETHRPMGQLIYCDPPYLNNQLSSSYFQEFDHEHFWETMRTWSKRNIVVVSESEAPRDFKSIWSTESYITTQKQAKRYVDQLFIHTSLYEKLSSSERQKLKTIH